MKETSFRSIFFREPMRTKMKMGAYLFTNGEKGCEEKIWFSDVHVVCMYLLKCQ